MSKWIVVDVESDGPVPGIDMYSMISFGAVVLDKALNKTFHGLVKPISNQYIKEALAISNISRETHESYPDPEVTIKDFGIWLKDQSVVSERLTLISDNPAYDWQWINYYTTRYLGKNPFGFSARRIGDIYSGLTKDAHNASAWKKYRTTKHTHNPVDDAMGNAEALVMFNKKYGFNAPIK
jgi:hypothetical protein